MRALLIGDVHLADRPPSIRTESYADDIFAKLAQTVEIVKAANINASRARNINAVVFAGDLFHVKTPSRTSHALVQRLADVVKAYPCPVHIVPGNHDIQHDRLESLDRQPLGVLFKAGAHLLIGQVPPELNSMLFGIPWLFDWKAELPGHMRRWRAGDARLMVTHAPIVPPGETRPYEYIDAEDWAVEMGRPGFVYYGHMHDVHGTYEVGGTWFCNQGALSRGSLHEESLQRQPAVTTWDSSTGEFTRIEIEHRPIREVFRLAEREVEDEQADRLDQFLLSVEETKLEAFSIEAVLAHVDELDLSPRTREVIRAVLEEAMSR